MIMTLKDSFVSFQLIYLLTSLYIVSVENGTCIEQWYLLFGVCNWYAMSQTYHGYMCVVGMAFWKLGFMNINMLSKVDKVSFTMETLTTSSVFIKVLKQLLLQFSQGEGGRLLLRSFKWMVRVFLFFCRVILYTCSLQSLPDVMWFQ